jgi:hypothetical protein
MRHFNSLIRAEDLQPGDHVALLYQTHEERWALLKTFLRYGLERHEKVLYIINENTPEAVGEWLQEENVVVQPHLQTGQLSILTPETTYLNGGTFDPAKMITLLTAYTKQALRAGYSGLRVMGEMGWASKGFPGSRYLIDYEANLNGSLQGRKCLVLCLYDRRLWSSAVLLYVVETHPIVAAGADLYNNPYYMAPPPFVDHHQAKTTLEWLLKNMDESKQTEKHFQAGLRNLSLYQRRA